jgi:cell shape-determining protein MreD
MRAIPYLLYLWLIGLHQVIFRDLTSVAGVTINLAAFMVLAAALYRSERTALWFGMLAGLTLSAGTPSLIGWYVAVFGLLGLIGYSVRQRLNLDSLYSKLLMVFGGVLLAGVADLILIGTGSLAYQLLVGVLLGAVYTSLLALVFFAVKEGIITGQKIKSLF